MKRPRVVPWALLLFEDIRTVGKIGHSQIPNPATRGQIRPAPAREKERSPNPSHALRTAINLFGSALNSFAAASIAASASVASTVPSRAQGAKAPPTDR